MIMSHHQVMENSICHRLKGQTITTSSLQRHKGRYRKLYWR